MSGADLSSTCGSLGPHHARCEIRRGHVGSHAGTTTKGVWVQWT